MRGKYWPQVKGKSGSFETYIEIPVTIYYDFQPPERQTRHYPGCPAAVCVTDIVVPGDYVSYILKNYEDSLEQECWDDLEGDV